MANLLANRKSNEDSILERRFVRQKLAETAKNIDSLQSKRMSSFKSSFWNDKVFTVSDDTLDLTQNKVVRFVDMRTRTKKDGSKQKKKSYSIYNRVVMGQYSQLTKELAYGFTEEVKNQLRNLNS